MIDRAISIVEEELEIIRTEREAFTRFLDRIQEIRPDNREPIDRSQDDRLISAPVIETRSGSLTQVRSAYRETVMEVPHYDREYGDTLTESLAVEFGETVAGQLIDGQYLTSALHNALLEASETARDERDDFIRVLRREYQSLQTIESELIRIDSRLEELSQQIAATSENEELARIDEALNQLDRQCTDLTTRRQDLIHDRSISTFSGIGEQSLLHYLYADLESLTPALYDITCCLNTIQHQRVRCLR